MAAEILRPRVRLAHNRSGANLVSGVASALLEAGDAELGLFEVDEGALPEVARRVRPPARCARQPLPGPARPLRGARARRGAVAALRGRAGAECGRRRERGRPAARRPRARRGTDGLLRRRRPEVRATGLQHAADSKWCVRCGTPYEFAAVVRRPPRRLPLSRLRARAAAARRRCARDRADGAGGARRSTSSRAMGTRRVTLGAPRAVQRLQRARGRGARARARRVARRGRLPGSSGSGPHSVGSSGSPSATGRCSMLLIKNPAGANEAVRTLLPAAHPGSSCSP